MDTPGTDPAFFDLNDEKALLARLRDGDEAAYGQVLRRNGPRMLAAARRFLQHEQDAQDAVQDAFLSAFRSLDDFQGDARLSTWLHRILINVCLMKLRTRKRKPEQSIEDLLPKFDRQGRMLNSVGRWAAHDTAVQDKELREHMRLGIDQLPDTLRVVLLLRDVEGHTTEEAANLLGVSRGAVKTRLHRARQALRAQLDSYLRADESLPGGEA